MINYDQTSHPEPRRIVSRDFVSGACDAPQTHGGARNLTSHDFVDRHTAQTLRDRKALSRASKQKPASYPLDTNEHMRRLLRTEFNGGMVLGFIFGVFFAVVSLALSFPAWVPLVIWMARS